MRQQSTLCPTVQGESFFQDKKVFLNTDQMVTLVLKLITLQRSSHETRNEKSMEYLTGLPPETGTFSPGKKI